MKTQKIRVERSFYLGTDSLKVGHELIVPYSLAVELRTCNKASFVNEPPPKATEPPKAKADESKAAAPHKGAK